MKTEFLLLSLAQLILSIGVGVIVLYVTYYLTHKVFEKKKYKLTNDNIAFGIFLSALLFSVGLIVYASIKPSSALVNIMGGMENKTEMFFNFMKYLLLFISIGVLVSAFVILISLMLFNFLTKKVKELEQISKGNISVALITAVIIIVISMFAKDSVSLIVESLMPYPEMNIIF